MSATLIINRWDSRCGACGGGADPYEKSHKTRLPGYSGEGERPGCGATFTTVASDYVGCGMEERCREMRPDLPWEPQEFVALSNSVVRVTEEEK